MNLLETIRVALAALRVNLLRSLLTMLGMVIGVGSVIAMIALGNGAQNAVKARIARLGTNVLQINAQRVQQGGVGSANTAKLTMKDVNMIIERAPHVAAVNMQQDRNLQVVWKTKNANVQITGTVPNFLAVRGFAMQYGRMISDEDNNARRRVAVLGADVLKALNVTDGASMLDEHIRIGGKEYIVVGVLGAKGATGFGDADEQILIPFNTGRFNTFGTDRVNDIWVTATAEDSIPVAMAEIESAIRRSHRIAQDKPSDFTIRKQSDFLVVLSESTQTFSTMLAGVASVSLLVGGIGIMNIMLVSDRTNARDWRAQSARCNAQEHSAPILD